jgi:hypothetical protein
MVVLGQEVRVTRVLNLDDTPWVLARAHFPVVNLNKVFRTDAKKLIMEDIEHYRIPVYNFPYDIEEDDEDTVEEISTSTTPHGYWRARTFRLSISTKSSEPTIAKGISVTRTSWLSVALCSTATWLT